MSFLNRTADGTQATWRSRLQGVEPCVDANGFLSGVWGEAIVEAVILEHTGEGHDGPAGHVIDFLVERGYGRFEKAADKLENRSHRAMGSGGFRARAPGDPDAWAARQAQVAQQNPPAKQLPAQTEQRGRSASSGSSSSGSHGSVDIDPASEAIIRSAPAEARIGGSLDRCIPSLPPMVDAVLMSKGARMTNAKHLKTSFHSTWLVDLEPPIVEDDGQVFSRAIVQVVGTAIGDRPLSMDVSLDVLVRAMELAVRAGVRVPRIFGSADFDSDVGVLGILIQEFIETQTVEDKVTAPGADWRRIEREVVNKLRSLPLNTVDTSPLQRYESMQDWLTHIRSLLPTALTDFREAIDRFESGLPALDSCDPVLIHQDINGGNLLASQRGLGWELDAIIDWESAIVCDPRLFNERDEPWCTARLFGNLAKGAHLAELAALSALPRCELGALVGNYVESAQELAKRGALPYQPWSSLVERCKNANAGQSGKGNGGY
eukprot:TRINITY_DN19671_c0_g2_i1.p1 TRINITY_DN19671_c0_g2~~TRINITY_DN19671_c0_g2_i1.p1  ORF type:complete len:490 (-),score=73.79 TRINITY_DN19671_c0_g2_i1:104-1573(-)